MTVCMNKKCSKPIPVAKAIEVVSEKMPKKLEAVCSHGCARVVRFP